ncbi:MAG: RNA polymerase sigma factor [Limisphaerales bacterium]
MDSNNANRTALGVITTTQWSVVIDAQASDPQRAQAALEELCRQYWYPTYAFFRRKGQPPQDSEDLTQSFFARLISDNGLASVSQTKGKFRSFLFRSLQNHLYDDVDKKNAVKRGGKIAFTSWDLMHAEELYKNEPADALTPEELHDRRWALMLTQKTLATLADRYREPADRAIHNELEPYLTREIDDGFYKTLAARHQISEGSARAAMHKLRKQFGTALRNEVSRTVATPEQVEEELRYFISMLRQIMIDV